MNVNGDTHGGSYRSTDGDTAGISELQQKTQNIDLATTTSTVTNFLGELKLNGTDISGGGGGGGGNTELINLTGKSESDYLSPLTGSSTGAVLSPLTGSSAGVENVLYDGQYITVKSATTMSAGRVVSFDASTNNADEYTIDYCNGGSGEQNASTQAVGVTLDDVVAGGYCRVAVKGICSVLIGTSTTAQRGCLVTVGGSASSYQGRVVCTSRTSNEPSIGICMSYGSKSANQPIVVFLQAGFESY